MKFIKPLFYLLTTVLILSSCCQNAQEPKEALSIKNAFKENFYIGAALSASQIEESDTLVSSLIKKEFNSITAENMMKSMHIHPSKDTFNFELPDKFVALGEKNNMFIHGHTLIWHSQLAPFMTQIIDSTEMVSFMQNHINTIVGRYKGKINSWDVVNEALNDDGTLRNSVFLDALGEEFLALAFKLAADADPEAELFYNDYSMTNPAKREGAIKLIKKLQESGVKVDGIGMQGHWNLETPSIEEIEKSILDYASLGVKVAITELDITVIPSPWNLQGADVNQNFEGSEFMNPYPESLPDSIQTKLAKRYADIFKLFLKHQDKISRVTFWGVNDGQSWKNDWPIKGRTNYPLLFDREFKPKKAYYNILALKEEKNKSE
ncbi:endo-1,4-beta-xylanase [Lutibacter flavus]|uniref:Beta-xylanase n=1 Tax=Lutibacter flavus TaxID=691689 RepID=A0A238Z0Y7_9FLAO|nr:endo-1,4-beta-xylanase [Lutibacter flavus]SNR76563.1 endo-1,4-beta-xylanase [Lutibacter flavus]